MKRRRKSTAPALSEKFGGKWTYVPRGFKWVCDDGNRYVWRMGAENDLEYTGRAGNICLYYSDKSKGPERVYL
jgi:hypothetical protein